MDEMDEPFFMTIYYLCMSRNFSAWRQTFPAMSLFDAKTYIYEQHLLPSAMDIWKTQQVYSSLKFKIMIDMDYFSLGLRRIDEGGLRRIINGKI